MVLISEIKSIFEREWEVDKKKPAPKKNEGKVFFLIIFICSSIGVCK